MGKKYKSKSVPLQKKGRLVSVLLKKLSSEFFKFKCLKDRNKGRTRKM